MSTVWVIAKNMINELLAVQRRWEVADLCGCRDHDQRVTMQEEMRQMVCAAPASSADIAARFGIEVSKASEALVLLLNRGEVGYCAGLFGPPDDLTKKPAPPLTMQERIRLSACAAPAPSNPT
jgi:hypothetical protein